MESKQNKSRRRMERGKEIKPPKNS